MSAKDLRAASLWQRFRAVLKLDRAKPEELRALPDLSDDDENSCLTTCFALGQTYYANEAARLDRLGNGDGWHSNSQKADFCRHLYELAREAQGKPTEATDDETMHRARLD